MTTHGMKGTRIYNIWCGMRNRCHNPNNSNFEHYGGRGIQVCSDWDNFVIFHDWSIKNGYQDNLTIDRINVNGNYSPDNCRWVTMAVQHANKRNSRPKVIREIQDKIYVCYPQNQLCIIHNNNVYNLSALVICLDIDKDTLSSGLDKGWTIDEIIEYNKYKIGEDYNVDIVYELLY